MKTTVEGNKLLINTLLIAFLISFLSNCDGPYKHHLRGDKNAPPPGKVSNVRTKSLPGGARISYNLPESKNLMYVKAVYTTEAQGKQQVKSSLYNTRIKVLGLPDTSSHKIKLYSVGLGGQMSEPVVKFIHPLIPPYKKVYHSIDIHSSFGGLTYTFRDNRLKSTLTIVTVKDSSGIILSVDKNHVSHLKGKYFIHGLEPKQGNFGYFVTDRYGNISDTTYQQLKPLLEVQIPGDQISFVKGPLVGVKKTGFSNMFDNAATTYSTENLYGTKDLSPIGIKKYLPVFFVMDLGKKYKISRIKFFGAPSYGQFTNGSPRKFELWGSSNPNWNDGVAFGDQWHKLGTFVYSPESANHTIDKDTPYPQNGINFKIDHPATNKAIRYLAFRVITTYSGTTDITIGELHIFGAPIK